MKSRKFLAILLAVALAASMLAIPARAAEIVDSGAAIGGTELFCLGGEMREAIDGSDAILCTLSFGLEPVSYSTISDCLLFFPFTALMITLYLVQYFPLKVYFRLFVVLTFWIFFLE